MLISYELKVQNIYEAELGFESNNDRWGAGNGPKLAMTSRIKARYNSQTKYLVSYLI